jgi:diguanylate cyclase (GGDEF)-like protein
MQRFTKERPRRRVMDAIAAPSIDADFDPVTGLATPAKFHDRAEAEWERRCKERGPMTLMLVEVDHFEAYQAAKGKAAADACLVAIAEIIARNCRRRGDFAGRVREHNFAVLLSETAPRGAEKVGEQIRGQVEALGLGAEETAIRTSISVASTLARSNRFVDSLLKMADDGLQDASQQGGNRVVSVRGQQES